ncbi:S8 family serine peptidase [Propioniciclava tarda]|uniref:Peptidase S8 n=1 Tax=Propioniciclava tarda TaxID=433330 RepID=A0A4Q9KQF3_PROTD|nr:S8 family serine peptidase [Propioniciclava tarda]TBT96139.1 hypothetical protein ET996_00240 [Propioniciclava tarda]SMO32331.1 PA domain-containing protein [Propioniciclava tarda]
MSTLRLTRRLATIVASGALLVSGLTALPAQAFNPNTDAPAGPGQDATRATILLASDPVATSASVTKKNGKVDLNAAATKAVRAQLNEQRNALKKWLQSNAPKAKVTGEFDVALNAVTVTLNGTGIGVLRTAPGVAAVEYEAIYTPQAVDPDLALVKGVQAWQQSNFATSGTNPSGWAGFGIKVGVVDTGIDFTHPCFNDAGFPATTQLGDTRFTNNKVIAARVFNNKIQQNKVTAQAIQSHGTHVAGTIGCNLLTPAAVSGVAIPYAPSGVAPGVQLGSYNVFPANIEDARSEDIFKALQAAAEDGMDVINMSLGGGAKGTNDLDSQAVNNLDKAGIVVAVANGNEGPGYFTAGSPGTAERALTAGASAVGHFVGLRVTGTNVDASAATGEFGVPTAPVTAPVAALAPSQESNGLTYDPGAGCAALPAGSLTGKIALISRGVCTFSNKVFNAEKAGAVAAIVINNVAGDPTAMASDPLFPTTIPAVMVGQDDKAQLVAAAGSAITIQSDLSYFRHPQYDNILAGFSSWGPTTVDLQIKPDVVAPGVNVLSSVPMHTCTDKVVGCWAFFSGTSMATPHLAGMAAVVRDVHPDWAPWQVRSAIINTSIQDGVLDTKTGKVVERDVMKVGSGRADLVASLNATVALSRPSVSFGGVPKGSTAPRTQQVTVTNLTASTMTLPVTVGEKQGSGSFGVDKSSITLAPGGSATLTISYANAAGSHANSMSQAQLHLGDAAHAALWGMSK